MSAPNTLLIIDEVLEKLHGHHFEYAKSVKSIFEKEGYRVIIYANENVDQKIKDEIKAIPFFKLNGKASYRKIPLIGSIIYRVLFWTQLKKQIENCIGQHEATDMNLQVFIPNILWYNVLPIMLGIKNVKCRTCVLLRISVIDLTGMPDFLKPLIKFFFNLSAGIAKKNKNIILSTDSEVIAAEWTQKYGSEMKVLPIPHLEETKKEISLISKSGFRLYAPGIMRIEKGMKLLTEGLEFLDREYPSVASQLIFITQFSDDIEKEALQPYKDRLKKLRHIKIEFLGSLSSPEYSSEIGGAKIILLPYLVSEGYKARTSGVMCEAIMASKPFITSKDTWMHYQADKYKTGLTVDDHKPEELANAIIEIFTHYEKYKNAAQQAVKEFSKFHSKDNFREVYEQ